MDKEQRNLRKGFMRLTLVLSLIAAVAGAILWPLFCYCPPPTAWYETKAAYISSGFIVYFSSVWALYLFIGYVIIPVIRFIKSGFEAK